jgi:Tol biopolymer transport system component
MIACAAWNTVVLMDADGAYSHTLSSFVSPVVQVAWTPDGTRLRVVLEENTPNTYTPWEVAVNQDGTARQVRTLPLGTNCCFDWTWIEGGRIVVYTRVDQEGKRHVMTAAENGRPDGTSERELPVKIGDILGLASPQAGRTLYFVTSNAARGELWKFDARSGEFKTFLTGVSGAYVAYSPDSKWITYGSTQDGSLFRSRADGSEALQLTKPPMYVEVSSWSPDGRLISFMGRQPGKPFRIYLIGRDGGALQEAAEGTDGQGGPSWSPDGKTLVYGNVLCEEMRDCWIRRLDLATGQTEIISGSHGCRTARWSPDGKYIAALHPPTHQLMLFDVNAQRWKMLADSVTGDDINWSNDSQAVYVDSLKEKNSIIERVQIKDGERRTIVNLAALERGAGMTGSWIGLTPDNSPILLRLSTTSEVYALEWTDR